MRANEWPNELGLSRCEELFGLHEQVYPAIPRRFTFVATAPTIIIMATANNQRMTRDEFRKARELEELRKTGAAPPEVDDQGRMINPHIPQYISQAPWYYHSKGPGLKHQYPSRLTAASSSSTPIDAAVRVERVARLRRGQWTDASSCSNCGSQTHNAKDCLERPRKRPAKYSVDPVIAIDERVTAPEFDYDGKRDRWNGVGTAEYAAVVQRYERIELERQKKKIRELEEAYRADNAAVARESDGVSESAAAPTADSGESDMVKLQRIKRAKKLRRLQKRVARATASMNGASTAEASDTDSDTESDNDSELADEDMADRGEVIQKMNTRSRTTMRDLRIREDTAKYLRNLAPNSAYYDPKTHSMRQNPYPNASPDQVLYAGDNFVRASGEVTDVAKLQKYVWDVVEKAELLGTIPTDDNGQPIDIHAVALPSAAEKLHAAHRKREEQKRAELQSTILSKYGGSEHERAPLTAEQRGAVSDVYVEYDEFGHVINGTERVPVRSRYIEDVYENGHTSVWGSFYDNGEWGYDCCRQTIKHALCTGERGKALRRQIKDRLKAVSTDAKAPAPAQSIASALAAAVDTAAVSTASTSASSDGALQRALDIESERQRRGDVQPKNRFGYNAGAADASTVPSEEEMEAFHRLRHRSEDPLVQMNQTQQLDE